MTKRCSYPVKAPPYLTLWRPLPYRKSMWRRRTYIPRSIRCPIPYMISYKFIRWRESTSAGIQQSQYELWNLCALAYRIILSMRQSVRLIATRPTPKARRWYICVQYTMWSTSNFGNNWKSRRNATSSAALSGASVQWRGTQSPPAQRHRADSRVA